MASPTRAVDDIPSWKPRHDENRVRDSLGARDRVTARDIPARDGIPDGDRPWAALREELTPADTLHRLARAVATKDDRGAARTRRVRLLLAMLGTDH